MRGKPSMQRKDVWDWMREHGKPIRPSDVEVKFILSRSSAQHALRTMLQDGSIARWGVRHGWYVATEIVPQTATVLNKRPCSKCHETLPELAFRQGGKKRTTCKKCEARINKAWRDAHPKAERKLLLEYGEPPGHRASLLLAACLGYPSTERVEIVAHEPELEAA